MLARCLKVEIGRNNMNETISESLTSISQKIEAAIERITRKAEVKELRGNQQRKLDIALRVAAAILAVASPALVTYSTTTSSSGGFQFAAIILSSMAGATITLQAVLGFQQNYIRDSLDALDLYELKSELESKKETALKIGQEHERYAALAVILSDATRQEREIMILKKRDYLKSIQVEQR